MTDEVIPICIGDKVLRDLIEFGHPFGKYFSAAIENLRRVEITICLTSLYSNSDYGKHKRLVKGVVTLDQRN